MAQLLLTGEMAKLLLTGEMAQLLLTREMVTFRQLPVSRVGGTAVRISAVVLGYGLDYWQIEQRTREWVEGRRENRAPAVMWRSARGDAQCSC
ncbi:unnamed protein product [Gongylonema pulchrum]|uniref:Uncharacterized protein n=1 Tax=Gongylonema pulchrum TaxID=637853 RepID=A0A183EAI5_9BILA|nr:unnamed protein product [Gongylonema pulchrum]